MSLFSSIAQSVIRGGLIKKGIKTLAKLAGKSFKGLKRGGVRATRGVKSGAAQARALPSAIKEAGISVREARLFFGNDFTSKDAIRTFSKLIGQRLKMASKEALSADAVERVSAALTKVGLSKGKSRAFKKLLANARANETWLQLSKRMGKNLARQPKKLLGSLLREGAENVAIDQTAQILAKAGGIVLGGAAAGATTGIVVNKKKKKRRN